MLAITTTLNVPRIFMSELTPQHSFPQIAFQFAKALAVAASCAPKAPVATVRATARTGPGRVWLQSGHGAKKKNQHADGHERERGAREKLRYSIETLAAPGLHESDQGENQSNGVRSERDRHAGLRLFAEEETRQSSAEQAQPKKNEASPTFRR